MFFPKQRARMTVWMLSFKSNRKEVCISQEGLYHDNCWETNSAKCSLCTKFLTWLVDNFLIQRVEKAQDQLSLILIIRKHSVNEGKTMGILGKMIMKYHVIRISGKVKVEWCQISLLVSLSRKEISYSKHSNDK